MIENVDDQIIDDLQKELKIQKTQDMKKTTETPASIRKVTPFVDVFEDQDSVTPDNDDRLHALRKLYQQPFSLEFLVKTHNKYDPLKVLFEGWKPCDRFNEDGADFYYNNSTVICNVDPISVTGLNGKGYVFPKDGAVITLDHFIYVCPITLTWKQHVYDKYFRQ